MYSYVYFHCFEVGHLFVHIVTSTIISKLDAKSLHISEICRSVELDWWESLALYKSAVPAIHSHRRDWQPFALNITQEKARKRRPHMEEHPFE
jgi:hypothetical protein